MTTATSSMSWPTAASFPAAQHFGIVALKSMAAGTPVIVADVGGLGTVVQRGRTGLTVQSENMDTLAVAITETLNDPVRADRLAGNALHQVTECFSWQVDRRFDAPHVIPTRSAIWNWRNEVTNQVPGTAADPALTRPNKKADGATTLHPPFNSRSAAPIAIPRR